MQLNDYPFEQLPFSKLYQTYTTDYSRLSDYYAANPFDDEAVAALADRISFGGNKEKALSSLVQFNERFELDEAARKNLERFAREDALGLVTGQQLGVYGGPIYTVLKTVTTIHLANALETRLQRPVIPVFWLADEDHDYEEIKSVTVLHRDDVVTHSLNRADDSTPPVADLQLPKTFSEFRSQVKEALIETEFSDSLWEMLDQAYQPGERFDKAFGNLIATLFSKHGLILAGSNMRSVKELCRDCMKRSITDADRLREVLESQTDAIKEEYHQQVTLYDSNLFYLDEKRGRIKLSRNGTHWKAGKDLQWTTEELTREIDRHPERFSPNVFLRPVLQDRLLPTLGYVAGPGEVAYYGQMKKMYEFYDLEMPVVFPRLSGTFMEPAIERIFGELPFELGDYGGRIEDLESRFVEQTEEIDVEAIFRDWKERVNQIAREKKKEIGTIDPTLEGAAGKANAALGAELDQLKGKVYRSIKQQEQTQLDRIHKIKSNLFPNGSLQERSLSFIYFMNKFGTDIWDRLLVELSAEDRFDDHKVIHL